MEELGTLVVVFGSVLLLINNLNSEISDDGASGNEAEERN